MTARPAHTITNWDRTQTWHPRAIHRPRTTEEVARIVAAAAERGGRVKPVGASLSWSDAPDIAEDAMVFDRLNHIAVDRDARRVTVGAGALLSDVNEALAAAGLAFENFGSITMQTAGGYTGTGTHGTGGRTPILSSFIRGMTLVDGTGRVRALSREREPALFEGARVHLGALGAVTELTIDCVPSFALEERLELVDFDRALADLDAIVDGNDYVKLWWLPYNDRIQVYRFNRTDEPRTRPGVQGFMDSSGLSARMFSGLLAFGRAFPSTIPRTLDVAQRLAFRPHVRVDRSDKIIRYAGTIPWHQETEYAVPRERAAEAIEAVRRLVCSAQGYRVNFPQEIRFVAADDIPLSCAHERDCCYIGGYVAGRAWASRYFAELEPLMADFRGRPHWGKTFHRTAAELRELYPRYDDFDALRRACDPAGVFRNRFIDRVFPPA